jgi:hypothetical protein
MDMYEMRTGIIVCSLLVVDQSVDRTALTAG